MSISTGGTDVIGGGFPAAFGGMGGGGIGGLGLVGLIGLNSFLGNRGLDGQGGPFNGGAIPGTTVAEQGISDLKRDVAGVNTTVHALGNEIQGALAQQTLGQTQEFMNLYSRLCDSDKASMQAMFAIQTQGLLNTQVIKDQAASNQVINQENFCAIKEAINADGDATRALINQNVIDDLRSQLAQERRGRDLREIEVNVTQTNQQTQNQLQAQLQAQAGMFATSLNSLGDQINRQTNSIVNLGTMAGTGQNASNANTRVNS